MYGELEIMVGWEYWKLRRMRGQRDEGTGIILMEMFSCNTYGGDTMYERCHGIAGCVGNWKLQGGGDIGN